MTLPDSNPLAREKIILFVDDDEVVLYCLQKAFRRAGGYRTITATNILDALDLVNKNSDLYFIVSDINLKEESGIDLFLSLRRMGIDIPFMFMSGQLDAKNLLARLGPADEGRYVAVEKPISEKDIIMAMSAIAC